MNDHFHYRQKEGKDKQQWEVEGDGDVPRVVLIKVTNAPQGNLKRVGTRDAMEEVCRSVKGVFYSDAAGMFPLFLERVDSSTF